MMKDLSVYEKAAMVWDLACVDDDARMVVVERYQGIDGPRWTAVAPNGELGELGEQENGKWDTYTAAEDDPAVALKRVMEMVAEDLDEWLSRKEQPRWAYRCGWCGMPCDENGRPLGEDAPVLDADAPEGTETGLVNGLCCPHGDAVPGDHDWPYPEE